jgi:hypothetical protein
MLTNPPLTLLFSALIILLYDSVLSTVNGSRYGNLLFIFYAVAKMMFIYRAFGLKPCCFIDRNRTALSTPLYKIRIFVAKTQLNTLKPLIPSETGFLRSFLAFYVSYRV